MTINIELAIALLLIYQIKHYVADFPLQSGFMLNKRMGSWGFVLPLLAHVAVHGAFTLAIVLTVNAQLWWLALLDMAVHFAMDRIKSGPKYLGRFNNMEQKAYWMCVGFDQMIHHLTHYLIIWILLTQG